MNLYLSIAIIALIAGANCEDIQKRKVVVVIDSSIYQTTHSLFFDDLRTDGYEVDFANFNSPNLKLKEYGEYKYDHMIIMATSQPDKNQGLTIKKITDFFDAGNNVFIAGDVDSSKFFRQLYSEFGLQMDDYGSYVVDNFNHFSKFDHRLIHTNNQISDLRSFGDETPTPILYRGVGLRMSNFENFQVWGVLRGENSTLSIGESGVIGVGRNIVLVGAVQGRNNARAILTGSIELFSNDLYKRRYYSNRMFIRNLLQWNFGLNGVLKAVNIRHHKLGETESPFNYKITDMVHYAIDIYRYNCTTKEWVPYIAGHDIMLEFVMLDPYIRIPLKKVIGHAAYEVTFRIPDKYGVFQFKIDYQRPGYTFLQVATKVTVRPPKHNEFPRFIQQAYPYYFSTFGTIAGLIIFIIFYLFDMDKQQQVKKDQ